MKPQRIVFKNQSNLAGYLRKGIVKQIERSKDILGHRRVVKSIHGLSKGTGAGNECPYFFWMFFVKIIKDLSSHGMAKKDGTLDSEFFVDGVQIFRERVDVDIFIFFWFFGVSMTAPVKKDHAVFFSKIGMNVFPIKYGTTQTVAEYHGRTFALGLVPNFCSVKTGNVAFFGLSGFKQFGPFPGGHFCGLDCVRCFHNSLFRDGPIKFFSILQMAKY